MNAFEAAEKYKVKLSPDRIKLIEIFSDNKWHCWDCLIREHGIGRDTRDVRKLREKGLLNLEKTGKQNYGKRMYCPVCERPTFHRRTTTNEIDKVVEERLAISDKIRKRVIRIYNGVCVAQNIKRKDIQIDHRVPCKRRGEEVDFRKFTDEQLKDYFMPLSAHMNELKKSHCENCINDDIRGCDPSGLNVFYDGTEKYEGTCEGCFWYDPIKWREHVGSL